MKKVYLLLLLMTLSSYSQKINQKITKINDKYKIENNGRLFDVDMNTITIKLKKGVELNSNYKFYRKNKLGYVDLKVPKDYTIENYISLLSSDESIEKIEYNSIGHYIDFIPNDDDEHLQWYLSTINYYNANEFTTGNSNVIVGVLDSGTDWLHSDLGLGNDTYQNIYLNAGEDTWSNPDNPNSGNGIDDDGNGLIDDWKGWNYANNSNDVRTINFHGTQVSGIIGAKTNNNHGIAGIAGGNNNEGVKILPYCIGIAQPLGAVLDDAIIEAVDNGVKVIQLSLSVAQTNAIDNAIQYAINRNVIIICASGNGSSNNIPYPASNNNVIAVGATDQNEIRANFSNFGNNLDIVAPGVGIYGLDLNDNYITSDGTSFAAPQVSAVAALIYSINPSLTVQEVRDILETTADKVGGYNYTIVGGHPNGTWDDEMGYGRLNAKKAVETIIFEDTYISGSSLACSSNTVFSLFNVPNGISVNWQVSSNLQIVSSTNTQVTVKASNSTVSGSGYIKAIISGYEIQKIVWVGPPSPDELDIQNSNYSGQDFFVAGEQNVLWVTTKTSAIDETVMGIDDYDWNYSSGWSHFETEDKDMVSVVFVPPYSYGYETVYVRACNTCGEGNWHSESYQIMQNYYLSFSPNPTYDETTITIEQGTLEETNQKSESAETASDKIGEWDLEIYNIMNVQKLKKDNLKSKSIKIQTAGWTEGIYLVRVKYKDEILTGKLLVIK